MAEPGKPNIRMVAAEEIDQRTDDPGARVRYDLEWQGIEARCEITVEVRAPDLEKAIPKARDELHRIIALLDRSGG